MGRPPRDRGSGVVFTEEGGVRRDPGRGPTRVTFRRPLPHSRRQPGPGRTPGKFSAGNLGKASRLSLTAGRGEPPALVRRGRGCWPARDPGACGRAPAPSPRPSPRRTPCRRLPLRSPTPAGCGLGKGGSVGHADGRREDGGGGRVGRWGPRVGPAARGGGRDRGRPLSVDDGQGRTLASNGGGGRGRGLPVVTGVGGPWRETRSGTAAAAQRGVGGGEGGWGREGRRGEEEAAAAEEAEEEGPTRPKEVDPSAGPGAATVVVHRSPPPGMPRREGPSRGPRVAEGRRGRRARPRGRGCGGPRHTAPPHTTPADASHVPGPTTKPTKPTNQYPTYKPLLHPDK